MKVNSFNLQSHFFSCYPLCLGSKNFSCSDTFIIIYIHIFDRRFNNIVTLNATKGQQSEKRCSLSLQFGKIHPTPATNQIPGFSEYPLLYYIKNELIHFINFGVYFVFNKKWPTTLPEISGATDSTIEARVKALQAQLAMMPQSGEGQKK